MRSRWLALGTALLALVGCQHPEARLQSEEEAEHDKEAAVQTIGDFTAVANAQPIPVSGVSLVTGLNGTGGPCPPSGFVEMLVTELRKRGVDNIKEVLSSPDYAVVLVSAMIPAGARKGDPIDVEISLPPQSKVKSLRGGSLLECQLYDYASTRMLSPEPTRGDKLLRGHPLARAKGQVLVGFGDGDEAAQLKQGRIWGGARVEIDRPFWLSVNPEQQFVRVSMRLAERINETFQGTYQGPASMTAEAKTKEVVSVRVPEQYRHNLARFLRVARMIPYQGPPAPNSPYRKKLADDILDPSRTVVAALRLEALGESSTPALKKALKSNHALVRFAAGEALAYLGNPVAAEELAKLAVAEPMLRAYALTALAALGDEAACARELRELLGSPSAETRYGAFMALRVMDERESNSTGELLNESFWVHRVAPGSSPLVHLAAHQRAEIVLFGEDPALEPPFSFLAGPEFTVTAADGDERCTVSRFSVRRGTKRKQCGLKVYDVLKTLAELDGVYSDAAELLRQADKNKCLSCPLAIDALPDAPSVVQLARAGRGDSPATTDGEILNARSEFGATPNLFQRITAPKPRLPLDD